MRVLDKVPVTRIELSFRPEPEKHIGPEQLRGAIAASFPDEDIFHQHNTGDKSGKVIYRYPLIQYHWSKGKGAITGFRQAAERLSIIRWLNLDLLLGNRNVSIQDARLSLRHREIGIAEHLVRYRFDTPWLPFNQKNYANYQTLEPRARRKELDRILVGHILAALNGVGVRVDTRVYASFHKTGTRTIRYKNNDLVGAYGSFVTNINIPTGLGLGKAVSHGYGCVQNLEEEDD